LSGNPGPITLAVESAAWCILVRARMRPPGGARRNPEALAGLPELPGLLITHRFPLRDYRKAVRAFLNKRESGAIKIVLEH